MFCLTTPSTLLTRPRVTSMNSSSLSTFFRYLKRLPVLKFCSFCGSSPQSLIWVPVVDLTWPATLWVGSYSLEIKKFGHLGMIHSYRGHGCSWGVHLRSSFRGCGLNFLVREILLLVLTWIPLCFFFYLDSLVGCHASHIFLVKHFGWHHFVHHHCCLRCSPRYFRQLTS